MDSNPSITIAPLQKDKLVVIMGATGTGKSRLSLDLATGHFPHSQVINSDKMQVYRGLDITTNKLSLHEQRGVHHHVLGEFDSIDLDFTPSQFRAAAGLTISNIVSHGNLPLLVGGSNSFIHALLAEQFDPMDDVFSGSSSVSRELRYDCLFLWVDVAWPVLCDYLCKRVDDMLDSGMFEELARFYDPAKEGYRVGIRKAIGVPEFDRYFQRYPPWEKEENGGIPDEGSDPARKEAYEEAVREIKDNTCRLAKRQIGKILRLRGAGWDIRKVDATASFRAVMASDSREKKDWRDRWEREVMEPSVEIVKRFLE
ncbi:hypothetical protein SLEP1_g4322 [Rubroshorea leprosula]|uniref:adenylate dimethylallyltransferase (ADP/ATP-dependent) n=1 Tax=Rubroshorea leprosula TaxID=152421 RepID=A0AAV5HNT9_9ROSI|nr:hypothetical protein SLEP1_g4322 [Rubroshorea leprosula]